MKKITLLLFFLMGWASLSNAQCINTNPYPVETIVSNNSGDPQQIQSCVYTGDFSTVSNLIIGNDYTFSIASNGVPAEKFITVTDISNNTIASGLSPLTVDAIGSSNVRIHYSENAACQTLQMCLESYITVTLTCPFPTEIQISGVTTTEAVFSWTPGDIEEAWEVMILPKGSDAPSASTSGNPLTGTPGYSVDDLESGHRYQFYIRADCGSEYSPWRGPYDFNTACEPVALLNENFDTATDGELPNCWTALKVNAGSEAFIVIDGLSNSQPNAVQIGNGNSAPGAQLLLISPSLSTVGTGSHRLKFYTRGYGNVTLQVGTIDTTTSDGTFNLIETINATSNYTEHIVDFTEYSGEDTFIAFRHANTSTYNPVFIDDVRWEAAPLCPDVQDIEMKSISQTSATIQWEEGNASQWDVVYSATSNDPSTLTPISPAPTEPEATLSGLQPNTIYKAWVRSSCGETLGNGVWMNPITFTTACNAVGTLNQTFESTQNGSLPECWSAIISGTSVLNSEVKVVSNNAASGSKAVSLFNGDEDINSKIILVSPALNTVATGTHRIKFFAKSNVPGTLKIGTLDSAASGGTFTEFQTVNITPSYSEYIVDFTTYTGTDNYIGIKHASEQYVGFFIDNIRWELTPMCSDVTAITVSNTTAASVFLDWTSNAGETQWDVVYGTEETNDPNILTPITPAPSVNSETTLSGLTPNTVYKVWVRSACGGTQGNGAWIGPVQFRTACLPVGIFTEGFETAQIGSLPDCWSSVLAGPTLGQYAAVRTVNNDAAFGNNAVEIHANSSAPTDWVMLVSPYLNTMNTGTHRLKFYALSYNAATPFEIGTMNGNTSQATYTLYQAFTLGNGYNEYVVDFTEYSGTDSYIAFRNVAGNLNSTFIDNVRWEVSPSCPDVSNLQTSDIGTGTATVSWTSGNVETNWQVVSGPVSVTDPATLTPSELLTETSYQISGMADNSFYNAWVRSVCGGTDGFGAWIGPIKFRTKCLPTTAPYVQDFESATIPNLPDCTSVQNINTGNDWNVTWGDSGYGFDGQVLRYNGNSTNANSWFYTRAVHLIGGSEYVISYKYGNNSNDNYTERLQVLYGTAPTAGSMLNEIADHSQINTGIPSVNTSTFIPFETGDYYFGFLAYSAENQSQLFVDNISISPSLSVPDTDSNTLIHYPNPVKDILQLSYAGTIDNVTVINLLGQKVIDTRVRKPAVGIDMSRLPSGSYIVKVTADSVTKTIKVLKQ